MCANCPTVSNQNENQIGDACEGSDDTDGDGVPDTNDNCPNLANSDQLDTDEDGLGDRICDPDKDDDGILNEDDNCRLVSNPDQIDVNKDGQGEECDDDGDGDGILKKDDNCPHNSQIGGTDFRGIQPIDLCTDCTPKPNWEFRDGGKEIWQGLNSVGAIAIAIGQDRISAMDVSRTIYEENTGDNDLVGFVFSFQDTSNFYVVYSSKHDSKQGPWKIVRVNSTTGPSN